MSWRQDPLLGIALHEGTSFPVGKVDFCNLYPMTFREFLRACGQERFVELMDSQDFTMLSNFKSKIANYLRTYYFVGGMPENPYGVEFDSHAVIQRK